MKGFAESNFCRVKVNSKNLNRGVGAAKNLSMIEIKAAAELPNVAVYMFYAFPLCTRAKTRIGQVPCHVTLSACQGDIGQGLVIGCR